MVAKDSFSNYNSIETGKNLQLKNDGIEQIIPNDEPLISPNRSNI